MPARKYPLKTAPNEGRTHMGCRLGLAGRFAARIGAGAVHRYRIEARMALTGAGGLNPVGTGRARFRE